jgi:triosephosphate isomerase
MKPIIIINFKTYKQGKKAVKLAKELKRVDKSIIIGVQASDVYGISKATKLKVYSEHVDYFEPGRNTGYIIPEAVKKDGATGTFLNHSEHKLKFDILKKTVKRCKKIGLKTAIFASSLNEAKKIKILTPDYLIYEPPELVAGKISVSMAKPGLIKKIAKELKYPFLVGAGVHSRKDLEIAMKFGARGIALSNAIVNAKSPSNILKKLLGKK